MTDAKTQGQQPAEEPLKVQVARALGWREVDPKTQHGYPPGRHDLDQVPDFAADPAWVLRMIEANGLYTASGVTGSEAWSWSTNSTAGESLGEAVCRWVVAARSAGIEVKQ
jgi:hypothetical protein